MFQTEFEFTLPCGYLDEDGTLHRDGVMRRATAADEILPLKDPRVQKNEAYLIVILLSRVVTRLGGAGGRSTRRSIEGLFATDLAYLQDALQPDQPAARRQHELPALRQGTRGRRRVRTAEGERRGSRRLPPRSTERGGGLHRLPLPLVAGTDHEPRAP